MPEVLSRKKCKARKEHECNYCGLPIVKGQLYLRDGLKGDGDLYSWIYHLHCGEIPDALGLWDYCDEGLSGDGFRESVRGEYQEIMSEFFNDEYESKDFKYPSFEDQLKFVCKHYKIELTEQ